MKIGEMKKIGIVMKNRGSYKRKEVKSWKNVVVKCEKKDVFVKCEEVWRCWIIRKICRKVWQLRKCENCEKQWENYVKSVKSEKKVRIMRSVKVKKVWKLCEKVWKLCEKVKEKCENYVKSKICENYVKEAWKVKIMWISVKRVKIL